MKKWLLLLITLAAALPGAQAQGGRVFWHQEWTVEKGDSIPLVHVLPVYVFSRPVDLRRYRRLVDAVKKVYPIAQIAKAKMATMEEELCRLPTKKAQKEYIKQIYHEIKDEYTPVLKHMTRTQGRVLLKLIDRETEYTAYEVLKEFREKASAVGVKQFVIQTHFQSPLEVTPEAREAIRKILSAGWLITNQLVYTVAASRRGHTTRLRQVLNSLGVVCYYTFSVKGFGENYTVFTPNSRSMQEQQEEKLFGRMTAEQTAELDAALTGEGDTAGRIRRFMKKHRLPFLATDRSVLNLPAIGKSMTFRLVGITAEGKRILRFDHDRTRRHSPIIDRMGEIYIVENKSVAAYLRQLEKMGEDAEDYASIWGYTHGQTEPRFGLYVYPDFPFGVTDRVSNLELE